MLYESRHYNSANEVSETLINASRRIGVRVEEP
jgi:hypothetical protein